MKPSKIIHTSRTISVTDLRRDPSGVLESAGDMPIAVLNHNRPTAYLLSAKAYETLLEKLDDVSLINLVKSRRGGKTVKVTLEDL